MNKIIEIKFGSHLYGTDTPNSDLDLKGIYLPTAREIVLGKVVPTISTSRPKQDGERNTKDDVDIEMLSLGQYLKLLLEGQTMALDILFAPAHSWTYLTTHPLDREIHHRIFVNRHRLLNRNVNAFVGYAKQQASKYGQKGFRIHAYREAMAFLDGYPFENERIGALGDKEIQVWIDAVGNENIHLEWKDNNGKLLQHINVCGKYIPFNATFKHTKGWLRKYLEEYGQRAKLAEQNQGIDWKALSHAVRVNSEAQEVLTKATITFPRPDRELLLRIKTGQIPFPEVSTLIDEGLEKLKECAETSALPEKPDYAWADELLWETYTRIVKAA